MNDKLREALFNLAETAALEPINVIEVRLERLRQERPWGAEAQEAFDAVEKLLVGVRCDLADEIAAEAEGEGPR
jgi:hypothetical protein